MIGDISLICDSPIVLIDEIENAGIDKQKALNLLCRQDKLVLVVTHDPHTALMSEQRIVLSGGAITAVVRRTLDRRNPLSAIRNRIPKTAPISDAAAERRTVLYEHHLALLEPHLRASSSGKNISGCAGSAPAF